MKTRLDMIKSSCQIVDHKNVKKQYTNF